MSSRTPPLNVDEARKITRKLYGIEATAHHLYSYDDQNFLLEQPSGRRLVLKISNATETRESLDFQNRAMEWIASSGFPYAAPRACRTLDGELIGEVARHGGDPQLVRLLTWVDGELWADRETEDPELLHDLGRLVGYLVDVFADFTHPAMNRHHDWDLKHLLTLRRYLDAIEIAERRGRIERILDRFESSIVPRLPGLPASVIYNDVNPHNVLLDADGRLAGLIDFGDMVHSTTVAEVAVAMAYAMLDSRDPAASGRRVLEGYRSVRPLSDDELDVVFDLALARLVMSVTYAAHRQRLDPENTYISVSTVPAWGVIEELSTRRPD